MRDDHTILAAGGAYGVAIHHGRHVRSDLAQREEYRPRHCYSLWVLERGTLRLREPRGGGALRAPCALLLPADPALALDIPAGVRLISLVFDVIQVPRRRGRSGRTWVHVQPELQPPPRAIWGFTPPLVVRDDCWRSCRDAVAACCALWWRDDLAYARANTRLQAWLTDYVALLARSPARDEDGWLARARATMAERFTTGLRVAELARGVGMSPSRFTRRFVAATGVTPAAEILRLRVDAACAMLRLTDTPVREIGVRCGFRHASGFTLRFRAITGMTPTAWRRARRLDEGP